MSAVVVSALVQVIADASVGRRNPCDARGCLRALGF